MSVRALWSAAYGGQKLSGEPAANPTTTRASPITTIAANSTTCTCAPTSTPHQLRAKSSSVSATPAISTGAVTASPLME